MAKKITKKENFMEIVEILNKQGATELVKVMEHEIELLENKTSKRKPTATQIENKAIAESIVEYLTENENATFTISDIIRNVEVCNGMNNQRVSAIIRPLKENGTIVRTESKGRAYFGIAKNED